MSNARWLWVGVAILGVVAAVAILVGITYGDADIDVTAVDVSGDTLTGNVSCPAEVVRTVDVSVTLGRGEPGLRNPQLWGVGVTVRAAAFAGSENRVTALRPGETRTLSVTFTAVREGPRVTQERVETVVQVTTGNRELVRTTRTVRLAPVAPDGSCS